MDSLGKVTKIHHRSMSHTTATTSSVGEFGRDSCPVSPTHGATSDGYDLQGASHTSGGIFRGKAIGNAFNMADKDMIISS
jgi:hypothetical protein